MLTAIVIFTTILDNFALLSRSYWLSIWVSAYEKSGTVNVGFYLGIFALCNLVSVLFVGGNFLVFQRAAWLAARTLHFKLINGVMKAPLSWWKEIPVGRVVNRFSRDMDLL